MSTFVQGRAKKARAHPKHRCGTLDEVDKELEQRGHAFVRFADDCHVYVRSLQAGARVLACLRRKYARFRLRINEEKSAVARVLTRSLLGIAFWRGPGGVLRLFVPWKKSPLAGGRGVALSSIWKGGSHEYPTCSTVKPTEVPGGVDARRDDGAPGPALQAGCRGAAARDDEAQARPNQLYLCGPSVCGRRAPPGRGVHHHRVQPTPYSVRSAPASGPG